MTQARGGYDFAIDLPGRIDWASIEPVRQSIQKSLSEVFAVEGSMTVAMVARELLENATKYGNREGSDAKVRLRIWLAGSQFHVSVENEVKPDDAGVAELLALLTWIEQFETPAHAFRARLLGKTEGVGGLGIARIAHEGNCTITAGLVDSTLCVTAHIPIEDAWRRLTPSRGLGQASTEMESFGAGDLRIELSQANSDAPIILDWRGNSIDANPALTVTPYVRGVYGVAAERTVPVEMRFDRLDYFNSATVSVLIQLIQEARTRRLKVLLTYDATVKWQRLNFEALGVFANELLTLRHT